MKEKNTKSEFNFEGAKPVGDKFKGAKIAKTFRIDMEVFMWLRAEAERTHPGVRQMRLLPERLYRLKEPVYLSEPNTLDRMALPVPAGSLRILRSSSAIIR